nr:EOG090X0CGF [Simocephalus serrulatus]
MTMNAMVDCLLYHDDLENAISWMDKMVLKERPIFEFVYQHWIKKCAIHPGGWTILSNFLHRNSVFLKQSIAHQLKELLESQAIESPFVGRFTTVEEISGTCHACHQILKSTSISDEEFTALKERLMEKVLLGTDVFLGSRPEEMKKFHKFIEKTAPYDVVIDGLNVAYHNSVQSRNQPGRKVEALLSVVKHFTNQNLRVLILTRKHLLREPVLSNIKQRAYVFITDDLSRDDPFLLYAAVQSKYTKFVSDDLFRDHIFRLGDPRLEALFRTWQHSAQIQIIKFMKDGSVKFHHPRKYRTVVQFAEGSWHIPYDDGTPRFSYQVPNTWLCLQPQTLSGKNGIK